MPRWFRKKTLELLPDFCERSWLKAERKAYDDVVLGICVMDVKARGRPMRQILQRIQSHGDIKIIHFGNETILGKPIEEWPVVDVLISFASSGFPLDKAIRYVDRVRPFCINDLRGQKELFDRRLVYQRLMDSNVPIPEVFFVSRDKERVKETNLVLDDTGISYRGHHIAYPFVEKPIDGERHDVWVYHGPGGPAGAGIRKLFRKVDSKSSEFVPYGPKPDVRRNGSFIYEQFLEVHEQRDLKAYTVLPDYVHGELRKTPTLDGIVDRDEHGRERRQVCIMTDPERAVAKLIGQAFGQRVCGFDILRISAGKFVVCDVNGWSFVKDDHHYYDQCARVLRRLVIQAKRRLQAQHSVMVGDAMPCLSTEAPGTLEAVVAVYRYADRAPKGKAIVELPRSLLLRVLGPGMSKGAIDRDKAPRKAAHMLEALRRVTPGAGVTRLIELLEDVTLPNMTLTIDEGRADPTQPTPPDAVATVTVKWGGHLTHAGVRQTMGCARAFDKHVLPSDPRRHQEFLHDVRVFHGSGARTRATAETFYTTLAEMNRCVQMQSRETVMSLDHRMLSWKPYNLRGMRKSLERRIVQILGTDRRFGYSTADYQNEEIANLLPLGLKSLGNPAESVKKLKQHVSRLVKALEGRDDGTTAPEARGNVEYTLCDCETRETVLARWRVLWTRLDHKVGTTLIKDIYDNAKYDALHSRTIVPEVSTVFPAVHRLVEFILAAEYGILPGEKRSNANSISSSLFNSIVTDMELASNGLPRTIATTPPAATPPPSAPPS